MINESAWGHRQELKTRSLKLAEKKNSSVCWQLCVPRRDEVPAEAPSQGQQQATLAQASCERCSGNTIRLGNNSCRETKGVFCIWCLVAKQWTSLLLKKVYSSVVKNVPPPQVWGRKWQARRGENKREVVTAYLFPPGTRSVAQIDPRAFQNSSSN